MFKTAAKHKYNPGDGKWESIPLSPTPGPLIALRLLSVNKNFDFSWAYSSASHGWIQNIVAACAADTKYRQGTKCIATIAIF
jgi:hypothetical protein